MKIVLVIIKISFLEEEEEVFESKPVITRKYIISIIIDIIISIITLIISYNIEKLLYYLQISSGTIIATWNARGIFNLNFFLSSIVHSHVRFRQVIFKMDSNLVNFSVSPPTMNKFPASFFIIACPESPIGK